MKHYLTILILISFSSSAFCQHYGGLYLSPNWVMNNYDNSVWTKPLKNFEENNYSFGYSIGYQGLLLEDRRFSFTYGLNFDSYYLEYKYEYPDNTYTHGDITYDNIPGSRFTLKSLEIPATWRYNILKNKKLQPYISLSTIFSIAINTKQELLKTDGSFHELSHDYQQPFSIYFDLGIGVNYKVNNCIFSIQPTIRTFSHRAKIGIGFSVLKKF